jgi:hypothetical protein
MAAGGPKTTWRDLVAKFQSAPAYLLPVKGAPVMPVDNLIERYAGLFFFKIQNDEGDVVAMCKEPLQEGERHRAGADDGRDGDEPVRGAGDERDAHLRGAL